MSIGNVFQSATLARAFMGLGINKGRRSASLSIEIASPCFNKPIAPSKEYDIHTNLVP